MATCGLLLDEVLGKLESWSLDEEQATTLAAPMTAGGTTFTVTSARSVALGISSGIIEIDSELMYVSNVSGTSVTIEPWGRGYKNTVPAAHNAGARVVSQPLFPRSKILDAVNQTLGRVFPELYAVTTYETTSTLPVRIYPLPAGSQWLIDARWQVPNGTKTWQSLKWWRVDPGGGTQFGDGPGITVELGDAIPSGRPLAFRYASAPGLFTAEADVYKTVTGLPDSTRDVIVLGTASALVQSQELSRLQVSSVEQQNRSQLVAPSAALTSSRYLEQAFQQRLKEERQSLQRLYPPRIQWKW